MIPAQIENITVIAKANIYFDGKVVSHTVVYPDGSKKTLGIIYPGSYTFNTGAPERMDMVAGGSKYRLKGQETWTVVPEGAGFDVPGNSAFDIAVEGICEYLCSFLA